MSKLRIQYGLADTKMPCSIKLIDKDGNENTVEGAVIFKRTTTSRRYRYVVLELGYNYDPSVENDKAYNQFFPTVKVSDKMARTAYQLKCALEKDDSLTIDYYYHGKQKVIITPHDI